MRSLLQRAHQPALDFDDVELTYGLRRDALVRALRAPDLAPGAWVHERNLRVRLADVDDRDQVAHVAPTPRCRHEPANDGMATTVIRSAPITTHITIPGTLS